jgi:hypothetical protein
LGFSSTRKTIDIPRGPAILLGPEKKAAIRLQGFDIRKRRLSILGLGGQPDSKADIVDDHQDLVGKLKAEF